jgi:hypothetical protein
MPCAPSGGNRNRRRGRSYIMQRKITIIDLFTKTAKL